MTWSYGEKGMNECTIRGCRNLEWRCKDCGRVCSNAEFGNKWISIKDILPEENELVLLFGDDGVFRGYYSYGSFSCHPIGSYAGDGCVFGITHWMPLPEPPNET